jgi:hypothetical protein
MAEMSDRKDCLLAWRSVLRLTGDILPCAVCRAHFHSRIGRIHYAAVHHTPEETRQIIRHMLWDTHREILTDAGKESVTEEALTELYGGERATVLQAARALVTEIQTSFTRDHIMNRIQVIALPQWVRAVEHLLHVLVRAPAAPSRTYHR